MRISGRLIVAILIFVIGMTEALAAGKIHVLRADYGRNCRDTIKGNATSFIAIACDEKSSCNYSWTHEGTTGDVFPNCPKNLLVEYDCVSDDGSSVSRPKSTTLTGEASGQIVRLDCSE